MKEEKKDDFTIARENWQRYQYGRDRGHDNYITVARKLECFYMGGGKQWADTDRAAVEGSGRPCIEINTIFPAINTAIGEQIKSRADIAYRPRNSDTDQQTADTISKVTKQICDTIKYQWIESQIYSDGMIEQRGFIELFIDFDRDAMGEIAGEDIDPLDIVIDPDANGYDPESWADVIRLKWMTIDEIEQLYGKKKAGEVETRADTTDTSDEKTERNSFGDSGSEYYGTQWTDGHIVRYLIIYRQHHRYTMSDVLINPNGRIEAADIYGPEEIARMTQQGHVLDKRILKKVRWTVSTGDVLLHDDWSPYRTLSIIPYFPYFRRGQTVGMVDNAVSPQELLNKTTSQNLHIVNTSANSGWLIEENSLVNLQPSDLESQGAKTGLVVEYRKGYTPPQKIPPNPVPEGIDRMADKAESFIKKITGMSDAEQGQRSNEQSGVAIQARQYQAKTQLGGPLDNLAKTRNYVGRKLLELIQDFYTEEKVFLITDTSDPTQTRYEKIAINQPQEDGTIANHVTVGEYDVVITDQPIAATFEENQFNQAMKMREQGVGIPDSFIVSASSLANKNEIVKALQAPAQDPMIEAKKAEIEAKIRLSDATIKKIGMETSKTGTDAVFAASQAAALIAGTPQTAEAADAILLSTGFEDQNAPPIVPQGMPVMPMPDIGQNTSPGFPARPDPAAEGVMNGIETMANEGVM